MKKLLIASMIMFSSSTLFAHTPGRVDMALRSMDVAIFLLSGSNQNFELANSQTEQARRLLTVQLQQETNETLRVLLRGATLHLLLAVNDIKAHAAPSAIQHLNAAADSAEAYEAGGGQVLGLCCTRADCKGCTLGLVTLDDCKAAGIYKTFRKHDPANPYPNAPLAGQCVTI